MKAEEFSHEIVGTSRTFYRSQDLKVVIEGDTAKTDGSVVYIPALDMSKPVDLKQQMITRGYVDHEAGHGRHTNMDEYQRASAYEYAAPLANGMEDVRIERLIIDEYPGALKNLEAVSEAVNKFYLKGHAKDPAIGSDFRRVGAVAITWEGRRRLGYDCPTIEKCLATLDPAVRDKVNGIVDQVMKMGSTKEVVDAAIILDGELSASAGASGRGPGGRSAGGSGSGKSGVGGGTPGAGGGGAGAGSGGMITPEAADALSDYRAIGASAGGGYRVWTWERDRFYTIRGATPRHPSSSTLRKYAASKGEGVYEKSKSSIAGHVNLMRRKLERALISKQNRGWARNQEEGQLDSRRLVAAISGSTNVHRQREPVEDLDVSVLLVVDLSGSMNGEKIILARKAAISYAEALDKVRIPFAVTGFTVNYDCTLNPANRNLGETMYRNYPLDLYIFKDFNDSLKQAKAGIGCITSEAVDMGDNADGDSLLQLYWKLLKTQKTKRRIMIVFSDGQPAAGGGNQSQRLRDVVSYLEEEKVELVGVGILSDAPKSYYKKYALVNTVQDLAKTSLDQLAKLLIDPKFRVDNSELLKVAEKLRGK